MYSLFPNNSNLFGAIDHFIKLTKKRAEQDTTTWQSAMQAIYNKAQESTQKEFVQAQQRLTEALVDAPLTVAADIALCSGCLIEMGAPVDISGQAILTRTHEIFIQAIATEKEQKQVTGKTTQVDDTHKHASKTAVTHFAMATFAVVSHSAKQRHLACNNAEFMQALQECPAYSIIQTLQKVLTLLENETVIVLHPGLQRGYQIVINDLGLNFQLHTLLADALIGDPAQGWLPGEKPDPRVVAAAKDGPVPQDNDNDFPSATGAFNLWNWQGLQSNGLLPDGYKQSQHWIWNEGTPADIAPFEGTRVILLGPPPYQRGWNAGRLFPSISGELEVQDKLSEEQVRQWLARITEAIKTLEA